MVLFVISRHFSRGDQRNSGIGMRIHARIDHAHADPRPLVRAAELHLLRRRHEARIARWLMARSLLLRGFGIGDGVLLQRRRGIAERDRIKQRILAVACRDRGICRDHLRYVQRRKTS